MHNSGVLVALKSKSTHGGTHRHVCVVAQKIGCWQTHAIPSRLYCQSFSLVRCTAKLTLDGMCVCIAIRFL